MARERGAEPQAEAQARRRREVEWPKKGGKGAREGGRGRRGRAGERRGGEEGRRVARERGAEPQAEAEVQARRKGRRRGEAARRGDESKMMGFKEKQQTESESPWTAIRKSCKLRRKIS
jgi:hypothetical protein